MHLSWELMAKSSFRRGSHRVKKRMSRAVTSSKALLERMPAEYVEGRRRLEALEARLNVLVELGATGARNWQSVLATRRHAADLVLRSSGDAGMVEAEAAAALDALHAAERDADVRRRDATGTHIAGIVGAYLTEIASVRATFADVEAAFHETRRYDVKLARLRAARRPRDEKITSNTAKLAAANAKYHAKLSGVMAMIEKTSAKRDAFLQSSFYGFWLSELAYELPLVAHSRQIREIVERRKARLMELRMSDPNPLPVSD